MPTVARLQTGVYRSKIGKACFVVCMWLVGDVVHVAFDNRGVQLPDDEVEEGAEIIKGLGRRQSASLSHGLDNQGFSTAEWTVWGSQSYVWCK